MITVFILASRRDARYADEFWIHLAMLRRQMRNVTWVNPLYVENMVESNALVPVLPEHYVVVGCMSPTVVSALLDQPALRELVQGARIRIPFLFSPCAWNQAPSPFAGLMPAAMQEITSTAQRDSVFVEAVMRLRERLIEIAQEG